MRIGFIGLGMMGMRAPDFWALTLVEWRAALAGFAQARGVGGAQSQSMRRSELADLMQRFPDGES